MRLAMTSRDQIPS